MSVRAVPGGVLVEVRVRPRSRPGWKIAAGGLVIGVAAAPVGGAATEEARHALAKTLGVTPSRVSLHRGERSRTKVFAAAGVDSEEARAALRMATGGRPVGSDDHRHPSPEAVCSPDRWGSRCWRV